MANHFYLPFERKDKFVYEKLNEFEKYQLSFHPERPKYLDYINVFEDPEECFASETLGARLIQTHRAKFKINEDSEIPVMLIGQQAGPTSNYKDLRKLMKDPEVMNKWNNGMPTAASYERALKAVRTANTEQRTIIIFVDTPGADPTEESEAGGIAWRIGDTIHALADATVPTLSVIMNRACSGGAIGLTGCDVTLAMEYSTYLVITPEACSSILFHTRERANEAAEASRITSREGFELGIVDELIPETKGPAHRFPEDALQALRESLQKWILKIQEKHIDVLIKRRIERWSKIGHWETVTEEQVSKIQKKVSTLPTPDSHGYLKRHKGCYTENGEHKYDPVEIARLSSTGYVCETCGYRYVRPSVWDLMDLILDKDTFVEHQNTRLIVDKDILGFPKYYERLTEIREKTGLMTAMITGDAEIHGVEVVFCGADFGFLGASFCMSTGEKIWRAAEIAIQSKKPLVLQAAGGGARMHEGCSSMVSIPKAHIAISMVERSGQKVVTLITDPTLGGVAIGYGSRGIRLFDRYAGNIGFSGRRVIEQYTGHKTSREFQTTPWLEKHGHVDHIAAPQNISAAIAEILTE
jgi:acetyl-CoA carboxylase alpha subunit